MKIILVRIAKPRLWLFALSCCVSQMVLASNYEVPIPENAVVNMIAQRLAHNGSHYQIHSISSEQSPDEVFRFYKDLWAMNTDPETGYLEEKLPGWRVLSHLEESGQVVVQLNSNLETSTGFISWQPFDNPKFKKPNHALQLPNEFELVSSTLNRDMNSRSFFRVYQTHLHPEDAVDRIREKFERAGWSLLSQSHRNDAALLILGRGADQIQIVGTANGDGATGVVLNLVESIQ